MSSAHVVRSSNPLESLRRLDPMRRFCVWRRLRLCSRSARAANLPTNSVRRRPEAGRAGSQDDRGRGQAGGEAGSSRWPAAWRRWRPAPPTLADFKPVGSGQLPRSRDAVSRPRRLEERKTDRRAHDRVHSLTPRRSVRYTNEPASLELKIVDSGFNKLLLTPYAMFPHGWLREGDFGRLRKVDEGQRPAWLGEMEQRQQER